MQKSSEIASTINKKAILELLREKGPMSKADITRELHLSFPAVSYNVKKLQEENLIYEMGMADNVLGRKGVLLAFNSRLSYLIGVDIGRNNIRVMCSDIGGKILAYSTKRIEQNNDVIQQVIQQVYSIVEEVKIEIADVICMGIGVPGIYDGQTDCLKFAPFAETWNKQLLMQNLKKEFCMDIVIENSVNLGAIGERWQGVAKGYKNILYVDLGVGIGSAAIIDGVLMRGKNGAFGEIAYMLLDKDRLSDRFSEEGSLEKLIPSRAIGQLITQLYQGDEKLPIREVLNRLEKSGDFPEIQNVPLYFSMSLVNTIAVTNPDLLVIAGRLGCALYQSYKKEMEALIEANVPFPPTIKCTKLSEKASVYGAIATALLHVNDSYADYHKFR